MMGLIRKHSHSYQQIYHIRTILASGSSATIIIRDNLFDVNISTVLFSPYPAHSGEGEHFLTGQLDFFTKTAVTPELNVEKSIPRWEMNRNSEGFKRVIDKNWGGFLDQKPRFRAQKKGYTSST